jgi:small GTP-binding protein
MTLMTQSTESKSLKVILIGDGGTGKTSLANRFIHKKFSSIYKTTIGVDISPFNTVTKTTKRPIRFVLWDMSGQTHFKRFRSRFYSGTSGAIIIYDLTNAQTYRNVQSWLKECKDNIRKSIPFVLLGNKSDLTELRVELPRSEYPDIPTYQTSAKNGENVEKAFFQLFEAIINEPLEKGEQPEVKTTHISYENS